MLRHSRRIIRVLKFAALAGLVWLFIATGIMHLVRPAPFVRIVPPYFPHALWLVYFTGVCEIIGGVAIIVPRFRRAAAWGLIALLLAVFPANINMALHPEDFRDIASPLFFWLRLPEQIMFVAWTAWCGGLFARRQANR